MDLRTKAATLAHYTGLAAQAATLTRSALDRDTAHLPEVEIDLYEGTRVTVRAAYDEDCGPWIEAVHLNGEWIDPFVIRESLLKCMCDELADIRRECMRARRFA